VEGELPLLQIFHHKYGKGRHEPGGPPISLGYCLLALPLTTRSFEGLRMNYSLPSLTITETWPGGVMKGLLPLQSSVTMQSEFTE
jgi:hypothetical protein